MDEFQARAFDIEGEEEPDDNEPLTGEEYIKRVRWQAKRCPSVVIADIDYSKLKITAPSKTYFTLPPKLPKCKKELLPKHDWETLFLSEFSQLRQKLQYLESNNTSSHSSNNSSTKLPHINDKRSWYIFCFGSNNNNSNNKNENEESDDDQDDEMEQNDNNDEDEKTKEFYQSSQPLSGNLPTFSLVKRLDHVMVVNLVNYHIEWLEKRYLTKERSYWLYILFLVLEKPIDSDTSSNLRSLLRRLAYFRSKIESTKDSLLPSINILMTIVGQYFGQQEPGDIQTID
ncbi:hypothetical protein CYY_005646 [Polysphondylium violaceum]|uniref:Gem-associated protein 2 n=1 Tax=Polysphondylium violaceum TaxID=133409 RepID=A0A8J4PSJ1_9MYCE|nr:hypothetical protein CYY_005646 [Polysphondylium violaceum]